MKLAYITALVLCFQTPIICAGNNDICPLEQNSVCHFAGTAITILGLGMSAAGVYLYRKAHNEESKNSAASIVILSAKLAHLGVNPYSGCDNN